MAKAPAALQVGDLGTLRVPTAKEGTVGGSPRAKRGIPVTGAHTRRLLLAVGLGLLVLVAGGLAAWALFGPTRPAAAPASPSASVTSPPSPTPSETLSTSPSPSASDTPSPSAPTETATAKEQTPYCKAFSRMGETEIEGSDNDGNVDFDKLAKSFATLIEKYSAAAALAPESLKDDYDKVLAKLQQGADAVKSKDFEALKEMVKNLKSLNSAMDAIHDESTKLCS